MWQCRIFEAGNRRQTRWFEMPDRISTTRLRSVDEGRANHLPGSCPLPSAASWHCIQHDAYGTAARRFGLIADSHSAQVPKLPS